MSTRTTYYSIDVGNMFGMNIANIQISSKDSLYDVIKKVEEKIGPQKFLLHSGDAQKGIMWSLSNYENDPVFECTDLTPCMMEGQAVTTKVEQLQKTYALASDPSIMITQKIGIGFVSS